MGERCNRRTQSFANSRGLLAQLSGLIGSFSLADEELSGKRSVVVLGAGTSGVVSKASGWVSSAQGSGMSWEESYSASTEAW